MKVSAFMASVAGVIVMGLLASIIIPRAEADGFSPLRVEKVLHADGTTCYVVMGPKGVPRAMDCK